MTSKLYKQLPAGQVRVIEALVDHDQPCGRTYKKAAEVAGVSLGTLYTHLRRVRRNHPGVYAEVMKRRANQLQARHKRAVYERQERSMEWWRAVNRAQSYSMYGFYRRRVTPEEKLFNALTRVRR